MQEKLNLKNILTKKNLLIVGFIITLILTSAVLIPPAIVRMGMVTGVFSEEDVFILNSYHPTNPTYTYISNVHGSESTKDRTIAVVKLERLSIFLPYFKISNTLVSGKIQRLTLQQASNYAKNNDLVKYNPDPDNILVPSQNLIELEKEAKNKPVVTSEDRYYLEYSTYPELKLITTNDFKQLKKGMTWSEIEKFGIDYDNAYSTGFVSKKYERRARVKESNIAFVVMAFAEDIDDRNPNAPLLDVYVVYTDRTNKKLDLETK